MPIHTCGIIYVPAAHIYWDRPHSITVMVVYIQRNGGPLAVRSTDGGRRIEFPCDFSILLGYFPV